MRGVSQTIRCEKKERNDFEKDLFKVDEEYSFWKNYGKFEKTSKHKTCPNRKKKKLFGFRTKLSYYKVFHRTFISNRNEKTDILVNNTVYLGIFILE